MLDDEDLVTTVYEALRTRRAQSRTRGRLGYPAEVVLRLLLLKHLRQWSFVVTEREVRTNLLYREFTRVRGGKVPDAKTLGRLAQAVGPAVVATLHQRIVAIAHEHQVIAARKLRVDTTVVETNIHYPTDSSLLDAGVRVLTRLMKQATAIAGATGTRLRDRTRSVKYRLLEISRASRTKGAPAKEKLQGLYRKLLATTGRVVGRRLKEAHQLAFDPRVAAEDARPRLSHDLAGAWQYLLESVLQAIQRGLLHQVGSALDPLRDLGDKPLGSRSSAKARQASRRSSASWSRSRKRSSRSSSTMRCTPPARVTGSSSCRRSKCIANGLGRVPHLVTADAGFYSGAAEAAANALGVRRVSVPNRATKSAERRREQKKRWFKRAQKWRTGCEGRISVLKRRHGLTRCRYKGDVGMQRWVGLGVIADNLINLGTALARQHRPS